MSGQHQIRGLSVRIENARPDIDSSQVLDRLTRALDLIHAYAPRCLRRMQRDLAGIVVRRFPCRGAFFHQERECLVELTFTVNPRHSLAEIAASMVHEAMHARLLAMCGPLPQHQRAREERLCRKAELEFGLAIPDGDTVVQRARIALQMADQDVAPAVDWVEASRRVHSADGGILGA
ncbi:MAG TPA: hypothetical protein VE399_10870 [Gemmatimonadales bacterium]|jgi:hypothetical protein|nr:hypothetical protein [Gemmatimonadales bacterium]